MCNEKQLRTCNVHAMNSDKGRVGLELIVLESETIFLGPTNDAECHIPTRHNLLQIVIRLDHSKAPLSRFNFVLIVEEKVQ